MLPAHCQLEQVLSDFQYNAYEPGEKIPDDDIAAWSAWEANFFDVEQALVTREKQEEAKAQGKRKPRSKRKVPVSVKGVRTAAYHHLKALDKMVKVVFGDGLIQFQVINSGENGQDSHGTIIFRPHYYSVLTKDLQGMPLRGLPVTDCL